jgi:Sec-independent protein translocase protein TatA
MRLPKVTLFLIFLLVCSHVPLSSADEVHATSYSDSIDSQSTWSEVKVLPNAFDSNNATSTFIEANRCDGGSATCTSGQTFIILDIEVQMSSNTTRADVRWKMEAPDGSNPPDSKGTISILDYSNSNYVLQAQDTLISTSVRVQEIPILNGYQDTSNKITLRFALYHNGTSFASDELAMYVYTIYDVREDITDSDGDGIDDVSDSCPNGETGWTSTPTTDHDGDGCRDSTEDNDNDNDLILNLNDDCPEGELSWLSDSISDYDGDGCKDDHAEDDDDDNDGYNDTRETECESNPKNEFSLPTLDLDGDSLCDAEDPDIDGDGLANEVESNTSLYVDEFDTGTSSMNADSDGDSYCDGPSIPLLPTDVCTNPSDAFPNDAAAYRDTDADGMPDELIGTSPTGLIEDLDDDNDTWTDLDEASCGGTDPKDDASFPVDGDGDGICDLLDSLVLSYEQNGAIYSSFEAYAGQMNFEILPNLTGMEATTWEYVGFLPNDFQFDQGAITGAIVNTLDQIDITVWANNSETGINLNTSVSIMYLENYDGDSLPDGPSMNGLVVDDDDDNDNVLDVDDNCPKGEIGLTSDDDTDGDGCRDLLEIDLFQVMERNDLWFFENASSPLPESCLLEGFNNSILKCSTLPEDQLGRSVDGGENLNVSTNILAIEELSNDSIDGQWYNVYPLRSGGEQLIPRSNPLPIFETEFVYTVDDAIGPQCICGNIVYDIAVRFVAPDLSSIDGVNFNPETGSISGTPTNVDTHFENVILQLKQSNNAFGLTGSTVNFVVNDKSPIFNEQHNLDYTNKESYDLEDFNRGGKVTEWNIPEQLPTGLTLDLNGELTGTISEEIEGKSFTVYYNNSNPNGGGSFELVLTNTIQVEEEKNPNRLLVIVIGAIFLLVVLIVALLVLFRKKTTPLIHIGDIVHGNKEVDQSRNELVSNILPQQDNLNEHFALWCLERLKMKGDRKIGDDRHLLIPEKFTNWINDLEHNSIMEIKISIALNYPNYWTTEHESNARKVIDNFLAALASLGGKFDVGTGFFIHGGDGVRNDVQVEYSGTFVSGRSPKDLASHVGLIRTAIWDYCSNLKQRSVFVQLGTTIADCVNPLPTEASEETEKWLDGGGTHIDLPRESFEDSIEPQRATIQADLSF